MSDKQATAQYIDNDEHRALRVRNAITELKNACDAAEQRGLTVRLDWHPGFARVTSATITRTL